jgi:hypothetical protein
MRGTSPVRAAVRIRNSRAIAATLRPPEALLATLANLHNPLLNNVCPVGQSFLGADTPCLLAKQRDYRLGVGHEPWRNRKRAQMLITPFALGSGILSIVQLMQPVFYLPLS